MAGGVPGTEVNRTCPVSTLTLGITRRFCLGTLCANHDSQQHETHQGPVITWSAQEGCKHGGKGVEGSSFLSGG